MKKTVYRLSCIAFSCILLFFACSPEEKQESGESFASPIQTESPTPDLPVDDGISSQPSISADTPEPPEPLPVNPVLVDTGRGNQRYGYTVMRDDTVYLFGEGRRSIYRIKGETSIKLYEIPRYTTLLNTLSEWKGILYFMQGDHLYQMPAAGGKPTLLQKNVERYEIRDGRLYLLNRKSELYESSLIEVKNTVLIADNVYKFYSAEGGVLYRLYQASHYNYTTATETSEINAYPSIDSYDALRGSIQVVGGFAYYIGDDSFLYQVELNNGEKNKLFSADNKFIVHNNRVFLYKSTNGIGALGSCNLDGSDGASIIGYSVSEDGEWNGLLQKEHMQGFEVIGNYIYLNGPTYMNGNYLTVRIPIAGSWEDKQEEAFYKGKWISAGEYLAIGEKPDITMTPEEAKEIALKAAQKARHEGILWDKIELKAKGSELLYRTRNYLYPLGSEPGGGYKGQLNRETPIYSVQFTGESGIGYYLSIYVDALTGEVLGGTSAGE